jgi:ATP-dependent RNA helicase RhlE
MSFENLGLKAELLRAVSAQGYTRATPIQEKAVPIILQGRDVLAGAQTGTGKTAAFTLPLLQLLSGKKRGGPEPRALVLTPTRELAAQVGASVTTYGKHLSLRSTTIFGGVGINPQKDRLRRGVDILVATPGRLLDHAGQGTVDLSRIEILVLDEADRMLDMGFIHDIKRVLKLLPKRRQNLLFSATYSNEIKKLADGLLYKPELIEVARRNTAAQTVDQSVHLVDRANKRKLLSHLIHEGGWDQVLVFTRTKHGANRLSDQLGRDGITSAAIHGNKSQTARTRALQQFKSSEIRVLVATDIAARGLDIERLPHVVNFELPQVPEDYVHRIGRTGRAGSNGVALSLVSAEERKQLKDIQKLLKKQIPTASVPGFEATEEAPPANEARRDPPPRRRQNRRRNSGGRARASN